MGAPVPLTHCYHSNHNWDNIKHLLIKLFISINSNRIDIHAKFHRQILKIDKLPESFRELLGQPS